MVNARKPTKPRTPDPAEAEAYRLHPMDRWLRRELSALSDGADADPLPEPMAKLAAQIEERLTPQKRLGNDVETED